MFRKQMVRFAILVAVAVTVAFQVGPVLGQGNVNPTLVTDDG